MKIELTLSPDYVSTWGVWDAIRELLQNAYDEGEEEIAYDSDAETLTIRNANVTLEKSSLLLGNSTKANDEAKIGQFGEGYKVATIALLRKQKTITFYNGSEIWKPRFVKSRRFNSDILTFFIEKNPVRSKGLTVVVNGITPDEWQTIQANDLHLHEAKTLVHGNIGSMIDECHRVYVGGLYICNMDEFIYGYNFAPKYIKLGRDRNITNSFEIQWIIRRMLASYKPQSNYSDDIILDMIIDGARDVEYMEITESIAYAAYIRFRSTFGEFAVPCTCQSDVDAVPPGYTGVIVSRKYKEAIEACNLYEKPVGTELTVSDKLSAWFDDIKSCYDISEEHCSTFYELLEELKDKLD